jgi:hypothetical protein
MSSSPSSRSCGQINVPAWRVKITGATPCGPCPTRVCPNRACLRCAPTHARVRGSIDLWFNEPDKYGHEESVEGPAAGFGPVIWGLRLKRSRPRGGHDPRMRLPHSQARCYSSSSQDARPLLLTRSNPVPPFSRLSFAALPFPHTRALLLNC